jgi:hypothetical protein
VQKGMSALPPESGFPEKVMSALPSKADMCGATSDVRFGPIADIPEKLIPLSAPILVVH